MISPETTQTIVNRFFDAPAMNTTCIVVVIATIGVILYALIKALEDPVKAFFSAMGGFLLQGMREISGKAGYAGMMDLIIVVLVFALAFSIVNVASIANTVGVTPEEAPYYKAIILAIAAVSFLVSLKMSLSHEKFERLNRD